MEAFQVHWFNALNIASEFSRSVSLLQAKPSSNKYAEAKSAGREYDSAGKDLATGAFSGVLAPVTGGLGGAVGKTVATKIGIQAVKQVGKEAVQEAAQTGIKQGVKTALTNPTGYEYVGGNFLKKGLAYGAEMATDGAVGGAVDNSFRTAYDGGNLEEISQAAGEGLVGGLILSPVIGGGIKGAGKIAGKGFKKVITKKKMQTPTDEWNEKTIVIPKAKCAAPRAGFDETPQAYVNIIKNNKVELKNLCKEYLSNECNEEQFVEKFGIFLSDKMEMPYYPEMEKIISDEIAGGMDNTKLKLLYNSGSMDRLSELMSTIMHEMHHFLQQKEIFATMSIEDFSKLQAKADVIGIKKENPNLYKTQAEFDKDVEKQTKSYIKEYKEAGWESVIEQYPKNTDTNSPNNKRAQKLIEATNNYVSGVGEEDAYYKNLLELEAHDISDRTVIEIEYSVLGEITKQEYQLSNEVYDILKSDTFNDIPETQNILRVFRANPQNLIEIVRECIDNGITDGDAIIEAIL